MGSTWETCVMDLRNKLVNYKVNWALKTTVLYPSLLELEALIMIVISIFPSYCIVYLFCCFYCRLVPGAKSRKLRVRKAGKLVQQQDAS